MVGDHPPTAHVKNSHKPVWFPRDYTTCGLLKCGGDPCGQQISFSSRRSQYALACRASCGWKSTSPGGKSGRQRGCHEAQCGTPDSITAAFQTFKVTHEAQPKRSRLSRIGLNGSLFGSWILPPGVVTFQKKLLLHPSRQCSWREWEKNVRGVLP